MPSDPDHALDNESTVLACQVMNSLGQGLIVTSYENDWRFEYVNPAFCQLVGRASEDLAGMSMENLVHPEDISKLKQSRKRRMAGETTSYELRLVKPDGEKIHVQLTGAPRWRDGKIEGSIVMVTDLTDRIRSEQKVKASERRLADIISFLPDPTFVIDNEGVVTAWNKAMEELTGVKATDVLSKGDFEYALPFYRVRRPILIDLLLMPDEKVKRLYSNVQREGDVIIAETYIPSFKPGGSYLWSKASPLYDPDGNLIGAIESIRDITDRKCTEDALRDSEEKYRNVVERANDGITIIQDGVVKFVNLRLAEMWGGTVEEILGSPFTDYIHPDEIQRVADRYRRRIAGEDVPSIYEVALRRRDGIKSYAELNAGLITFQGKPANLVIVRDINERKQMEEALHRSEQEKTAVLDSLTNVAVEYLDPQMRIIWVNKAVQKHLGLSMEDLKGKYCFEILQGIEVPCPGCTVRKACETGRPQSGELVTPDGKIWVSRSNPIKDADGLVTGIVNVAMNITDRKREEEARLAAEERYRHLVENLYDVIFTLDFRGFFTCISPVVEQIFGYSTDEVLGRHFSRFIYPEDLPDLVQMFEQNINGQIMTDQPIEFRIVTKANQVRYVRVSIRLLLKEDRRVGLTGVISDITERKLAEEALRKAHDELELRVKERTEELEKKAAEMERFIYTVSHDLRSPLITVGGFVGFLERDLGDMDRERTKTDLRMIEDAVVRMDRLLGDTLELSRIGRIVNPPEDTPFDEIVKKALELTAEMLRSKAVIVSVAQDLPAVHVDRIRVEEVLVNLIENSMRYMGDQIQPKIDVGYRFDGTETVFFVRDNGMGIDPSQHEKVFGLFYKIDPKSVGTGAGLAIVRRIIEVHGGRIWIESELGKGCTVCFTLPLAKAK